MVMGNEFLMWIDFSISLYKPKRLMKIYLKSIGILKKFIYLLG
jgi:hypothetical protein